MNKNVHNALQVAWYLVAFLLIQLAATALVGMGSMVVRGIGLGTAAERVATGQAAMDGTTLALCAALSGLCTIALFAWRRWAPLGSDYVAGRPWAALWWVALLAAGSIIPSEWLSEEMGVEMSPEMTQMFAAIMSSDLGYLAIALLAPLAEEMVFRGAILRTLLGMLGRRWRWLAIAVSALLFGLVHGNGAQLLHAALVGLLLGWMYWRTRSIVPGLVFHWVNNTAAYLIFRAMPGSTDARLIDLFRGNEQTTLLAVGFSLCIMLPALYQLTLRLRSSLSGTGVYRKSSPQGNR